MKHNWSLSPEKYLLGFFCFGGGGIYWDVTLKCLFMSTSLAAHLLLSWAQNISFHFSPRTVMFVGNSSGLCTWIVTWFTSRTCTVLPYFTREISANLQHGLSFNSNFSQTKKAVLFLFFFFFLTTHCSRFVHRSYWSQKQFTCQLNFWDIVSKCGLFTLRFS